MTLCVTLNLPYPVSANRYWRSFVPKGHKRAIVVPSDEAKSYRTECGWIAKAAGVRAPVTTPLEAQFLLFTPTRAYMDIDNALKVAVDALKGVVYEDDRQIWRIEIERMQPGGGQPCLRATFLDYFPALELEGAVA